MFWDVLYRMVLRILYIVLFILNTIHIQHILNIAHLRPANLRCTTNNVCTCTVYVYTVCVMCVCVSIDGTCICMHACTYPMTYVQMHVRPVVVPQFIFGAVSSLMASTFGRVTFRKRLSSIFFCKKHHSCIIVLPSHI